MRMRLKFKEAHDDGEAEMDERHFKDRKSWRTWLAARHETEKGLWVVFYKKHTGRPTLLYEDAVEEAICFGWIDGLIRRLDADRCARIFTPRSSKSKWSDVNVARAEKMMREKRMTEAGLAKFQNGLRQGPPPARREITLSPEFAERLHSNPAAHGYFLRLAPSHRRQYIGWIMSAKKEETRRRRLEEAISRLERGEKLGLK
jgi:uncharacterized protein YdeI (YjbR/CyaY-like superfamily)